MVSIGLLCRLLVKRNKMQLNIFTTADEVLTALATYFIEVANEAITARGKFTISLSGGSSPKKLYELLASPALKDQLNWEKVYFFFGDERYVPHTDPESNYLMAQKAIFDTLEIDRTNIFPVDTSLNPDDAAKKYWEDIEQFFDDEELAFDLVLLGLGDDAHTA